MFDLPRWKDLRLTHVGEKRPREDRQAELRVEDDQERGGKSYPDANLGESP
jgi:hypothetical protein